MPFTSAQFEPKENPMSDVDPTDVPDDEGEGDEEAAEEGDE